MFARMRCGAMVSLFLTLGAAEACKTSHGAGSSATESGVVAQEADAASHEEGASSEEPRKVPERPLALSSRTVEIQVPFGQTGSDEVHLVGKLAHDASLHIESVDPPGPIATVVPADGGAPQGVRVTIVGKKVGVRAGQVTISTGLEEPRTLTLLYTWRVVGNITVNPTNPFIDLRTPPPVGVTLHVTSRRKDFRLADVQTVDGPFAGHITRDEVNGGYEVRVVVAPGDGKDDFRGSMGHLRLLSNDPAEPRKDVEVLGLGPLPALSARVASWRPFGAPRGNHETPLIVLAVVGGEHSGRPIRAVLHRGSAARHWQTSCSCRRRTWVQRRPGWARYAATWAMALSTQGSTTSSWSVVAAGSQSDPGPASPGPRGNVMISMRFTAGYLASSVANPALSAVTQFVTIVESLRLV